MRGICTYRRLCLTALIGLWVFAAVATHTPADRIPRMGGGDKLKHVIGYTALAAMFLVTLRAYGVGVHRRLAVALGVLLVYAAADEWTQPWFHRHASLGDWFADALGILLACSFDRLAHLLALRGKDGSA